MENNGDWCEKCLPPLPPLHFVALNEAQYGQLDGAWALGQYHGVLRDLITAVKLRGLTEQAAFIHTFVLRADEKLTLPKFDFAVPVPLHNDRQAERGFNQVNLFFEPWLKKRGVVLKEALRRTKVTRRQFTLNTAERRINVAEAFAVPPEMRGCLRGKNILLLDDILTTGSTLSECAKILKRSGAVLVYALVLASDKVNRQSKPGVQSDIVPSGTRGKN